MNAPDSTISDAELDEFAASQRRRKLFVGIGAALGVVAILAVVAIQRANKLPGLDSKKAADVRGALDQIPPEHRSALAAAALVELEGERLPAALLGAFDDLSTMPPGTGDIVLLAPFANDEQTLATWLLACPEGAGVLAEAGRSGGGAAQVYARCELGRLGLLGESELGGASLGELVATHAAWAHLVEHDSETDLERRVLRAVLGRR